MRNSLIFIVILLVMGAGGYEWYQFDQNQKKVTKAASTTNPLRPDDLEIIMPKLDPAHGKQLVVVPGTNQKMSVTTNQGVKITVQIPANALQKVSTVTLIPFIEDGNTSTLDTGILLSPGDLSFAVPVTILFDISSSPLKNDPHGTLTGSSHIFRLVPKKQQVAPIFIARSLETKHIIPGRITSGGAYTLSLVSTRGEALSRIVLSDKKSYPLPILEAASYLVGNNKSLSASEKKISMASTQFITSIPLASVTEFLAAQLLEERLTGKKRPLPVPYSYPEEYREAESTPIFEATPSATEINEKTDEFLQKGFINPEEDTGYNAPLESLQEPTPTLPF